MDISPETLRRLAQFDTPTLANVIELFAIRPANCGFTDGRIRALFPELPPMVGFACTASFRSAAPPQEGEIYHSLADQVKRAMELPGPAVMVFQDLDDPPVGATFGEIMCSVYKAFGSAGLITSGGGRDILQVRLLNYPVFVGATICSHGYCHILNVGQPVRVGGLVIRQGDLLHGDANGVLQIPKEIASEVADIAPEYLQAEQTLLDFARKPGIKTVAGLEAAQAEFAAAVARLRKRVARKHTFQ
jgi:4-hydroxy-4-methyl-2-oxoglutarate aldolase